MWLLNMPILRINHIHYPLEEMTNFQCDLFPKNVTFPFGPYSFFLETFLKLDMCA